MQAPGVFAGLWQPIPLPWNYWTMNMTAEYINKLCCLYPLGTASILVCYPKVKSQSSQIPPKGLIDDSLLNKEQSALSPRANNHISI